MCGLYFKEALSIVLVVSNSIQYTGTDDSLLFGICSNADITFSGSGSLDTAVTTPGDNASVYGIASMGSITASAGTIDIVANSKFYAYGFFAKTNLLFSGSAITIQVNADFSCFGVCSAGGGSLTVDGGSITVKANNSSSSAYGAYAGSVFLTSGSEEFAATNTGGVSAGIYFIGDKFTYTKGTFVASGIKTAIMSGA